MLKIQTLSSSSVNPSFGNKITSNKLAAEKLCQLSEQRINSKTSKNNVVVQSVKKVGEIVKKTTSEKLAAEKFCRLI